MIQPTFKSVKKRNGVIVPFDKTRILDAVRKAMQASGEGDIAKDPDRVTDRVIKELLKKSKDDYLPQVEEIQDIVEESLILLDYPKTAKAYILYRHERARLRDRRGLIPERVRELVTENKKHFRNALAEFIYYRTYSRWLEEEGRRETWTESVDRYMRFMRETLGKSLNEDEYAELREAILSQGVMPSMRLFWSSGLAARTSSVTAYNCSYVAPARFEDFGEIMYLLMCGTGVGFSVENQIAQQLPIIKKQSGETLPTHVIGDSKEGWARAFVLGLKAWSDGKDVAFDYSKVRPTGARLRTMGGRSSGPEPLKSLMEFTKQTVLSRQGRRPSSLDIHDIVCKIGEIIVAGGVRRSALISLSDLDDEPMRHAKTGQFYLTDPQRSMANNSVAYNERPSATQFLEEWLALVKSGTGERGIFNRYGLPFQLPDRRWKLFQPYWSTCGTNPCGEINLRSKQFCNLTEVVARPEDTEQTLLEKVRIATILGTYQATLTDFPYLSADWKRNCDEERLLGVSITGQWDCKAVRRIKTLQKLRDHAIEVNIQYAKRFGIAPSTAITCVKPSGTVSQLTDSASGLHPRYSPYYIRRVRISATDPLFHLLREQKFPYYPEVGQQEGSATTYVLEFPVKAPRGSIFRNDLSALEQLEYWKVVKQHFTEHNPSVTVYIGKGEWIEVANWLYKNWDILGGLSFLPSEEYVYELAPFEEITKERYEELTAKLPPINFADLVLYEKDDQTTGAREPACEGAVCEIA